MGVGRGSKGKVERASDQTTCWPVSLFTWDPGLSPETLD